MSELVEQKDYKLLYESLQTHYQDLEDELEKRSKLSLARLSLDHIEKYFFLDGLCDDEFLEFQDAMAKDGQTLEILQHSSEFEILTLREVKDIVLDDEA